MTGFTETAYNIFAPTDAGGDTRKVENADVQRWGTEVERLLIALIAAAGDLDLPNLLIRYTVTGGTANAIQATPNLPVPEAPGLALFSIKILQANTGNVSINGRQLLTSSGQQIAAGGLVAGGVYLFLDDGGTYRLLSDQASSAILSAAQLAAAAAAAAQAAAEGAAETVVVARYNSKAGVEAATISPAVQSLQLTGYSNAGDGGGALYRRVATEPTHPGKIQSADGAWWEIAEKTLNPAMFGMLYNGTGESAALNNTLTAAQALGHRAIEVNSGSIVLNGNVNARGLGIYSLGTTTINAAGFNTENVGEYRGIVASGTGLRLDVAHTSPAIPNPGGYKFLAKVNDERLLLVSPGGGGHGVMFEINTGNVAAPSEPGDSENGSWALWRTGVVSSVEYAWVWKGPTSETGTWGNFNVSLSAVSTDPGVSAHTPMVARQSTTPGSTVSFNVSVPKGGKCRIGFFCTASSPTAVPINLDGSEIRTVDLQVSTAAIHVVEIEAIPGTHTITVEHPNEAGTTLYVIGANFTELRELAHHELNVDRYSIYTSSPGYVTNRGASDYAISSAVAGTWAGSYHGGETARLPAEISFDNIRIPLTAPVGQMYVGRRLSILQRNTLSWASSSESMDIDSLTIFGDGEVYMSCVASNVNLTSNSAFLGMTTTSPAFDAVISAKFYGSAIQDATHYEIGQTRSATQIERGTGRLVSTEFSLAPVVNNPDYGGATVSYAAGAYAKLYSSVVRNSVQQMPSEFAWAFKRIFH